MATFAENIGRMVEREQIDRDLSLANLAVQIYGDDGAHGENRKSDVQKLIAGKHKPSSRTLNKLIKAFGWTHAEIDNCRSDEEAVVQKSKEKELNRALKDSEKLQRLTDAGITEGAITELASAVANDVDDLNQAWAELQNAVEVALRLQAEGARGSNHGDFVDQVLTTVADHAKRGEYEAAQGAIAAALAEEEAAHQARQGRLYASGIETAVLARDAATAAGYLIAKAQADGEGSFDDLRALWTRYYEEGRDKGLNFQLEISVALAVSFCAIAANAKERGDAQIYLGGALQTLGERESGTARLEQAVDAYRAALEEYTQDRVPLDWAKTQNNLGIALQTLGERESGTERLEQAIDAYRAALKECTRDRVPLDWAMTQNNLGTALLTLGQRESGTARLEQAIEAYRAALEERTRDRVPLNWAATQNNLGTALGTLGERESGTERLEQAIEAYRAALKERTRDRVPLDWAMTQNNLGNALLTLGGRESGTERLEQAVDAFRAALEERTQDRVPLDWAGTTYILGYTLAVLGERRGDIASVNKGRAMAVAARQVLVDGGHEVWAEYAANHINQIDAILSRMGSGDGAT